MSEILSASEAKQKIRNLFIVVFSIAGLAETYAVWKISSGDNSTTTILAAVFSGMILFISGIFSAIAAFRSRKKKSSREILREEIIAHWKYDTIYWQSFTQEELQTTLTQAKWIGLISMVAIPLLGLLPYFFGGQDMSDSFGEYFLMMLGIGAFCGALIWLLLYIVAHGTYAERIDGPAEVIITKNSLCYAGTDFEWGGFFKYGLRSVKLEDEKGKTLLSFMMRRGKNQQLIRIPVHDSMRAEAEKIVEYFDKK